ncbi:MAG TPA: lysylphosphatidylglycerol synthase domain-containing protein [Gemmatimonadaceae bacterium]|nr:lysylphosphatidylglycerol synthase domain-containing protein [Gemmatimonadaceae bacterium]
MSRGRSLWLAAQWVFAAAVIWYAARSLTGQWAEVGSTLRSIRPMWGYIATASLLVLFTYALLIESWRRLLSAWSARLSWPHAARIWLASNLGKYVPGKIWSILAMGALAKEKGASALAAGGSSVVMQIVSVITGLAVAAAFGASSQGITWLAAAAVALMLAAITVAPYLLPRAFAFIGTITGRALTAPPVPVRPVWLATLATTVAWLIAGLAFRMFAGALGVTRGDTSAYIAVYAASYVAGFLALFVPGGLGVREGALIATMQRAGLATPVEAAAVAVASRIWLTVLEVIPGLIALAIPGSRGSASVGETKPGKAG